MTQKEAAAKMTSEKALVIVEIIYVSRFEVCYICAKHYYHHKEWVWVT